MTLTDRLKKAVELKDNLSWEDEDALHELDRACLRGQYLENTRLQPILTALINCVEALGDLEFECRNAHIEEQHVVYEMANAAKALSRLEKELG